MLTRDLLECANFAMYFAGSPAAKSTPHLYISSLATWKKESSLAKGWQRQFLRIPGFNHAFVNRHLPLSTTKLTNLKGAVSAIAVSDDNSQIVAGLNNGYVGIWDTSTGQQVKILEGHTKSVRSIALSRDGKWIASGSDDNTVGVWDILEGKCLNMLEGHSNVVNSVSFSKNGLWISSGSDDTSIRIWNVLKGSIEKIIMGHTDAVTCVAFSSYGAWIASGSQDRSVRVWSTVTGRELSTMTSHDDIVTSIAISSNDSWIVSGSRDDTVRLWDATTFDNLRTINHNNSPVISIRFSGDDTSIFVFDNWDFMVWDTSTGKVFRVLQGRFGWICAFALSNDNTWVVSASQDGYVRTWYVPTSQTDTIRPTNNTSPISSLAISNDDTKIAFGTEDGYVHVWDVSVLQEIRVLKETTASITSIVFADDGTKIVWGFANKVCVWSTSRNEVDHLLECLTGDSISVALLRDGRLIGCFSNGSDIQLWDSMESVKWRAVEAHTDMVLSVVLSEDGQQLVTGSMDGSVRRWMLSGENLDVMWGHSKWVDTVAFSSNASRIASGSSDTTVRLWDASTGLELMIFRGHTASVRTVAFSSDGAYVVSGSWDYSVRIWDVSTGKETTRLRGNHTDVVNSISFSRNRELIVSGSRDGSVVLWDFHDPTWHIDEDNWILSFPSMNRLMWVPPDAHVLQRPNCHILIGKSKYSTVDFKKSEQAIGPDWENIYTPFTSVMDLSRTK